MADSHMGNAKDDSSPSSFYRGLMEAKCDNVLGKVLGFNEDQLAGLF